jgi:signal transduction histidine kinase
VLGDKLSSRSLPEAADANRIVRLLEEGIVLARNLARGLAPVELEAEGLTTALRELAKTTSERFGIQCRLEDHDPVPIDDPATAIHLFRIAQEAISNAIRHGQARQVVIKLSAVPSGMEMQIQDDGGGLPDPLPERRGMGLHIMQHRATMIGASFELRRQAPGTVVICVLDETSPKEIV